MDPKFLTWPVVAALVAAPLLFFSAREAQAGIVCNNGPDCLAIGWAEPTDGVSTTVLADHITGTGGILDATGTGLGTGFTVTVDATGSPNVLAPQPDLFSNSLYVATSSEIASEVLEIFVTEQNITGPLGTISINSIFNVTTFISPTTSVTEKTWVDPGNSLFANTEGGNTAVLLASQTFTADGATTLTHNTPNLTGEYSETLEYDISVDPTTAGPNQLFAGSINITDPPPTGVPEPATLTLLGAGLFGLGLLRRRRNLKA